jgi:GxxExxY protein
MKVMKEQEEKRDSLTYAIIGAAIEVHRALGPGFPESVYEQALCVELRTRSIPYTRQAKINVHYKGELVGSGRIDLLIKDSIIVELKAVDAISPIHITQVLSYLRMTQYDLGLIINFNVRVLKDGGIERVTLAPL